MELDGSMSEYTTSRILPLLLAGSSINPFATFMSPAKVQNHSKLTR